MVMDEVPAAVSCEWHVHSMFHPCENGLYRRDYLIESLRSRRAVLVDEVAARYGVTLYPDPRREHIVRLSESDHAWLAAAVEHDRRLDAVGRGYYSGLGGELTLVPAPDWTCDPVAVSLARLYAVTVVPWARPTVRALSRALAAIGR